MNAIELSHVTKHFPGFTLQDLSLTVPSGTICGLVGENGAGKSTTIRLLMGALRPDSGTCTVLGADSAAPEFLSLKEDIGVVLDEAYFPESLNALQVGGVMAKTYRRWDGKQYQNYLTRFGLPEKKPFKDFSRGMKMKLAIAVALSHSPRLLVLDEATSGLDPVVRSEMLDLFLEFIQDEEHSILLSSHITSDLEKVADYITFIHAGKIVFSKTKDDILEQYGVVKCEKARAAALDGAHILGRRDSKFDAELLVDNRPEVARLYPGILTEQATIDDIMTFFAKGAYDA